MRKDFFNTLCLTGIYPLPYFDIKLINKKEKVYKYNYITINGGVIGISKTELNADLKEYKSQVEKGVITYEIPFSHINNILMHLIYGDKSIIKLNDTVVNKNFKNSLRYTRMYDRKISKKLEKKASKAKYLWDITPEIFMANIVLLEDETYKIDNKNEKVIITRTLTPNSFAKEALKVEKVSDEDNIYSYHGVEFESELSLHGIRLQMGYDDSQELETIADND